MKKFALDKPLIRYEYRAVLIVVKYINKLNLCTLVISTF